VVSPLGCAIGERRLFVGILVLGLLRSEKRKKSAYFARFSHTFASGVAVLGLVSASREMELTFSDDQSSLPGWVIRLTLRRECGKITSASQETTSFISSRFALRVLGGSPGRSIRGRGPDAKTGYSLGSFSRCEGCVSCCLLPLLCSSCSAAAFWSSSIRAPIPCLSRGTTIKIDRSRDIGQHRQS